MSNADERRLVGLAFGHGHGCFTVANLASFAKGELPEAQAMTVRRHAEECPRCAAEIELAKSFYRAPATPQEAADLSWIEAELSARTPRPAAKGPPPGPWKRVRAWFAFSPQRLAVAATAVLVVAGGVYLQREDSLGRPRGGSDIEVTRSASITVQGPEGALETAPAEFRWSAVPGAVSYRVRVLSVDGVELWNFSGTSTNVALPPGRVRPGSAYQWEVSAMDVSGRTLARSSLHNFHIMINFR